MEQHVERLRQSLADGIAGIPYALSKVDEAMNKADMQVTEERAAREEAFAKLQGESKQEWTDQRHRLDDMNSRLTEMLATHQQMESSAAAKLEKDMEAVVTRFEGLNQDVESKLAAKLESAIDEKIAATGRKFQVAMGKWCKEAISKGEQGLSKERAAREQGESKLLAKLDQDCQALQKALEEGIAAIPQCYNAIDAAEAERETAETKLQDAQQALCDEVKELTEQMQDAQNSLATAQEHMREQQRDLSQELEAVKTLQEESSVILKQDVSDLKVSLWENLKIFDVQNERKLHESSEALWRTLQHIQMSNAEII